MLTIHFFGKSKIEYNGKIVGDQLGTKAYALICLLVLNDYRHLSRDKIIGYLWPDSNGDAARYNLRYNLWLIKKTIEKDENNHPFLLVNKETCAINPEYNFESDVLHIKEFDPIKNNDIETILNLKTMFQGEFLEGCYFKKCEAFNEWIIFERINFEKLKVKILKCLVKLYEDAGDLDACLETIQEIMEIEPYDEAMVEKTLDIYESCGNRTAAITYYNWFSNHLAGSLGIGPSEALRHKYNAIRSQVSEGEGDCQKFDATSRTCRKCSNSEGASHKHDDETLHLITHCIEGVPFFWMSSLIDAIVKETGDAMLKQLQPLEILALVTIQPRLSSYLEEDIMHQFHDSTLQDAAVVNAFIRLVEVTCLQYKITLDIVDQDAMDTMSAKLYGHIIRFVIS